MKKQNPFRKSSVITLFIVLAAITAMAATTTLYSTSGTSAFKLTKDSSNGIRTVATTTQNYDLYQRYVGNGDELYLISSKKTVKYLLDADHYDGTLAWNVRKGAKLQTALWSKSEQATELNVNHNQGVLITGLAACCGVRTGYRLWEIATGKLLMSFNDFSGKEIVRQPFSLEVPNSNLKTRYIGVVANDTSRDSDFGEPVPGKKPVALVKYASDSLKQKFQLDIETADGYAPSVLYVSIEKDPLIPNSDQIEINEALQVVLWNINGSNDPSAISGVILKIVMDAGFGEKIVRIPVRQDELKQELAEVPPGVQLRPVSE
jgi:hypothetical protein